MLSVAKLDELRPEKIIPKELNLLYYKSKTPDLLRKYKEYNESRVNIEIVPYKDESFNVFTFIDFTLAIDIDYHVLYEMKTKSNTKIAKIEVYKRPNKKSNEEDCQDENENYSFKIQIGENFSYICVSERYNMKQFSYKNVDDTCCIAFLENDIDDLDSTYYNFRKDSLLYQTAKYFANSKHACPKCMKSIFTRFQSQPTRNIKKRNWTNK